MLGFLFLIFSNMTWAQAPLNQVRCSADVMPVDRPIPVMGISSVVLVLPESTIEKKWMFQVQEVHLKKDYQKFYSNYLLAPQVLPPFAEKIIESVQILPQSQIEFKLNRFPATAKRQAGMSIEVNIQSGFYIAVLLDPIQDGPIKIIHSLFSLAGTPLNLSVHCEVVLESNLQSLLGVKHD